MRSVAESCAALRRLPEARWQQPPRAPLGARLPHERPDTGGPTLEARVRGLVQRCLAFDAAARGVAAFTPTVTAFALPDVLQTVAHALAGAPGSEALLAELAAQLDELSR